MLLPSRGGGGPERINSTPPSPTTLTANGNLVDSSSSLVNTPTPEVRGTPPPYHARRPQSPMVFPEAEPAPPRLSARQRARLEGRDTRGDLYSDQARAAREDSSQIELPSVTKVNGANTRSSNAETSPLSAPATPRLPTSVEELVDSCMQNSPISDNTSLAPGAHAEFADHGVRRKIDGEFGVEMLSRTGEPIARAGFDVTGDNKIFIGHSPQGGHKDELSHAARRELVASDFRVRMVQAIVGLAQGLGASEVVGYSADRNPKPTLPYDQARRVMDEVYEAAGFVKDPTDSFYHFPLSVPTISRRPTASLG